MRDLKSVVGEYGLYDHGVTIARAVGECVKVVHLRSVRKKGLEGAETGKGKPTGEKGSKDNYSKQEAAISRAKRMIKEYALCNPWDWFFNITIDQTKHDRFDLDAFMKEIHTFVHNYNRRLPDETKLRYLLIPEKDKGGAWHLHGFIMGIRSDELQVPMFIEKRVKGVLKMVRNSKGYVRWPRFAERFGHVSMSKIQDTQKVSNYITKYICKDLANSVQEYGANLYYCSRGMVTGTVIYRGTDEVTVTSGWDYERPDGFCKVKWYASADAFAADVRISREDAPGAVMGDNGEWVPDLAALMIL